jgi:hypothetical protein
MWNAMNAVQRAPFIQVAELDRGRANEERMQQQEIMTLIGM